MSKKPAAPKNLRNGLSWRDGRPRWEPSPASRKAGLSGMDLKTDGGEWMSRGAAIAAADARHEWAKLIREVSSDDPAVASEARADLLAVLERLPEPKTAEDRQARRLVEDLIAAARRLLDQPALTVLYGGGPKSVNAMVDGYFADPTLEISASTRSTYLTQSNRLKARFGHLSVRDMTRGKLRAWYLELKAETSISTANSILAATGAFFKWATWQDPPWIDDSPATKLGRESPPGRRVFWTVEEELAFVPWCDANGFADVADAVTFGLWTGASPVDMCKAGLEELKGTTWRYVRQKTRKRGREAVPGLLSPVKARLERRRLAAASDRVRALDGNPPFLYDFRTHRRHTSDTVGQRFREAKFLALLRDAVPETFEEKRVQDTRDTCITRLYEADVKLDKIPAWTGHSPNDRDEILRDHYICLTEAGALESAAKLATWAEQNGLAL